MNRKTSGSIIKPLFVMLYGGLSACRKGFFQDGTNAFLVPELAATYGRLRSQQRNVVMSLITWQTTLMEQKRLSSSEDSYKF